MRLFGTVLTIFSSMGIGFYFSALMKGRLSNLLDIKKTMIRLRGEITYAGTPLPEAIASASGYSGKDFHEFYQSLLKKLKQMDGEMFRSIWKECVENDLRRSCLSKKDKMEFIKFGEGIGYLDKTMQINTIDMYLSELEQEISSINGEINDKVKLYNVLGIMGGIFLVVLFM